MKPFDVKSKAYFISSKEIIIKDPKFKIGHIVRISNYENICAKSYSPNWLESVL